MKVLHLHSGLLLGAGIESIILNLMNENKDVTNYLCVINNKWSQENIDNLDKNLVLLCNRKEGTKNPFSSFKAIFKIYKFIKENSIDIIHCHNAFSLKIAYIIKKFINIKLVLTVHDTNAYTKEMNKYPVNRYIAISQAVYNVINNFVSKEKIKLVYNGVNLSRFTFHTKTLKKNDTINITCVARIMPEKKGQDILLRALGYLKSQYNIENFKCRFAGTVNSENSIIQLKNLTKQLDIEDNVEFLGNVENVEMVYLDSDIFVLPSRYEGFGLVVVEALAAGCSVIVSRLEGPLEIVKENQEYGMHFEKENYKELANKLYCLISDKDLYNHYSGNQNTLQYLEKKFSLQKMIQEYNKIYKEI